jgi:NADH:ubiquinone oxidoreductase subunit 3 (subunit A)
MANLLLSPLFAFLIYGVLVGILSLFSRAISMRGKTSRLKTSTYASGEEHDAEPAAPGYRPFFVAALFFAVLHLGVLMLGTSGLAPVSLVYLGGLMLALLALILG